MMSNASAADSHLPLHAKSFSPLPSGTCRENGRRKDGGKVAGKVRTGVHKSLNVVRCYTVLLAWPLLQKQPHVTRANASVAAMGKRTLYTLNHWRKSSMIRRTLAGACAQSAKHTNRWSHSARMWVRHLQCRGARLIPTEHAKRCLGAGTWDAPDTCCAMGSVVRTAKIFQSVSPPSTRPSAPSTFTAYTLPVCMHPPRSE